MKKKTIDMYVFYQIYQKSRCMNDQLKGHF